MTRSTRLRAPFGPELTPLLRTEFCPQLRVRHADLDSERLRVRRTGDRSPPLIDEPVDRGEESADVRRRLRAISLGVSAFDDAEARSSVRVEWCAIEV